MRAILRDIFLSISRIKNRYIIEYRLNHDSSAKIASRGKKYLSKLLNSAKRDVPYFAQYLNEYTITEDNAEQIISHLPLLNKNIIREQSNNIYSRFVGPTWRSWHNTGGSTGEPLKFPVGGLRFRLSGEILCQARLYKAMTGKWNPSIASVDGRRVSEDDQKRGIYWGKNSNNFPYGIYHFSVMYLNEATIDAYLQKINEVQPEVIRGYPSGLATLAKLLISSGKTLSYQLKGIYLTSENIQEEQIKIIEKTFNCKVWGQYGHSEASVFAYRRPNEDAYRCFADYGYTEIIKEDGTHAKIGEIGEVVVTGFQYTALPFIRYQTGDLAVYGGHENGELVISKLLGRSVDYIIDNDGNKVFLVGFIFGGHLRVFNHVKKWQIEQAEKGKLIVRIVKALNYTNEIESELEDFFRSHNFDIKIEYLEEIASTSRGKEKFLIQHLNG